MINYEDTLKIPLDALRATSAPLTLPDPTMPAQPQQGTSAPSHAPVTPIPETPLDTYIQHYRIRCEFRADMILLCCAIVLIPILFTVIWIFLHGGL